MANEKFKDKIIKVFGMEMDEEDQYDDEYDDEMVEEVEEQPRNVFTQKPKRTAPVQRSSGLGLVDGPEVLVLDPECFEDAPGIVNKIKEDKTVVVNLKNTALEEGHQIFDFLNGAVFALEGSINRIADNVFILAPKQVSVSTKMEKTEEDAIMPMLNWEDDK